MMRLLKKLDGNEERVNAIVNDIIKQPFGDKAIGNLDAWSFDSRFWDESRVKMGDTIHVASK